MSETIDRERLAERLLEEFDAMGMRSWLVREVDTDGKFQELSDAVLTAPRADYDELAERFDRWQQWLASKAWAIAASWDDLTAQEMHYRLPK